MTLRIISGTARGKKLLSLEGEHTRPTTDRVKESLFNLISPYVFDSQVLDLFAGSGALGVESLSRGAKEVVFIDNFADALSVTKKNVQASRFENAQVLLCDALDFLKRTEKKFDIIFVDPPYKADLYNEVLFLAHKVLTEDGIIVCESDVPILPSGYEVLKERKYGKTFITILKDNKK